MASLIIKDPTYYLVYKYIVCVLYGVIHIYYFYHDDLSTARTMISDSGDILLSRIGLKLRGYVFLILCLSIFYILPENIRSENNVDASRQPYHLHLLDQNVHALGILKSAAADHW